MLADSRSLAHGLLNEALDFEGIYQKIPTGLFHLVNGCGRTFAASLLRSPKVLF